MCRRRVKLMYRRLYQPGEERKLEAAQALRDAGLIFKGSSAGAVSTCAAVEGQPGGGVELLDEELRERNFLVCVQ